MGRKRHKRDDRPAYDYEGIRPLLQFDSRVRSEVVRRAIERDLERRRDKGIKLRQKLTPA